MTEERRKILEMVRDGIISIEEGEELLKVIENKKTDNKKTIKNKVKEDLQKTKEELLKAKDRLVQEYEKVDMSKVKDKLKKGIEKVDNAVSKVDEAIIRYGEKILKKRANKNADDQEEVETIDPLNNRDASFFDNKN